jgi:hypothetical protein
VSAMLRGEDELKPMARKILGVLRASRSVTGMRLREIAWAVGRAHYMPEVSSALEIPVRLGLIIKVRRGVYAPAVLPGVAKLCARGAGPGGIESGVVA